MKVIPKFLITHNEGASPGITYIVHTQYPAFVATIHRFNDLTALEQFTDTVNHTNFFYLKDLLICLEVVHFLNEFSQVPDRFSYTLKRALNWYIHSQNEA
ncbi:hypothetical protein DR864_27345 [Runella rosea]|uniref:Uncharacterized protein n=1 Tax=Runella rosea TaxID=2259595 RepID=A0A344TRB8_9BACT|nr:hypothetical protein [Runella rosea]AXE21189.1 hypothetical protein DR864_27345 [Runella rosea]